MTVWTSGQPWDRDVSWFSRCTVRPTALPISLGEFKDQHLRVAFGSEEDGVIRRYLESAVRAYEDHTFKACMLQTWEMTLSGFPSSGLIRLERPPLVDVTSLQYVDADGTTQSLAGSPAEYVVLPSGEYSKAEIRPLVGGSFPVTRAQSDAVTVTYRAGHATPLEVPPQVVAGIQLMAAELFKQRTMSVHAINNNPAIVLPSRFWRRAW